MVEHGPGMSALADMAKACPPSQWRPAGRDHRLSPHGMTRDRHLELVTMYSPQLFASPASAYRPWPFRIATQTVVSIEATRPKPPPLDEDGETDEGLALPVEPDEGTPLIPDDERVINVPS